MNGYKDMSAAVMAAAVRDGQFSAVELTKEALRLAKTEGARLNAFITLCEDKALRQAAEVDALGLDDKLDLPLCGVPVAIKDNISYTDYPLSCGSRILTGYTPPYDATLVTRLLAAGAIIIGKTNMDEFAMGSSNENSAFGPVRNPHDPDRTPGGSSGGAAAAVAAGIVPIAYGSDTGGSVRQPAAFCGLYGLKPTYGAVSRYGLVAFASSTDQISPLARSVEDLALACQVAMGHDPNDATSLERAYPEYAAALFTDRSFRIGIPREYYGDGLDPEIRAHLESVQQSLERAGHRIFRVSLPLTSMAIPSYYVIASAEASANLARFDGVRFGLREGGDESLEAMYAHTRESGFGPEVKRRIMLGTYALAAGYYDAYYLKASQVRELMRREFEDMFKEVDFLLTPTTPSPAFRLGEKTTDPLAMYLSDIYTVPASLAGIPALSIPLGMSSNSLPLGGQLMARPGDELSLLQLANILSDLP